MDEQTLRAIRARLQEEKASIERQLADYGATAEGDQIEVRADEGFADSGQATAERSHVLSLIERLQATHQEVTGALERIDTGHYGDCERCGQAIAVERLEAVPTTRLCVSCKQAAAAR